MTSPHPDNPYSKSPPENYERYFVPTIGAPVADDLVRIAALRPGERVLDVACGTGTVTRFAAELVGDSGQVAGLDINPGMLGVARSVTPSDMKIEWHEAGAESMPFPDESFDVVLCQMGLQFMPDKNAALMEMHRVLAPSGRVILNVPGPAPEPMSAMEDALVNHIGTEAGRFVELVFSLHDTDEIEGLLEAAGFHGISIQAGVKSLPIPKPADFLWQYVHSTPLAELVGRAGEAQRSALEGDVVSKWQELPDQSRALQVRMVVASARK